MKKLLQALFDKIEELCVSRFLHIKECGGIEGKILICAMPETSLSENSESLREKWIGCEIGGRLLRGKTDMYQPYSKEQPALPNTFEVTYIDAIDALRLLHGEKAKECIEFWEKHYEWSDSNYQAWISGSMRLVVRHTLLFDRECFYFIPDKKELSFIQKKLWQVLEILSNLSRGYFRGVRV